MLNGIAKVVLVFSATAPLFLTYAVVAFIQGNSCKATIALLISGTAVFIAWWFIDQSQKKITTTTHKITSIETADSENLSFMLLYLLPLLKNDINSVNLLIIIPIAVILAWVIFSSYGYHFNPVLSIFGWHYFKVGTPEGVTYILISKRAFRSGKQTLQVKHLSEYIILDIGENDAQ